MEETDLMQTAKEMQGEVKKLTVRVKAVLAKAHGQEESEVTVKMFHENKATTSKMN